MTWPHLPPALLVIRLSGQAGAPHTVQPKGGRCGGAPSPLRAPRPKGTTGSPPRCLQRPIADTTANLQEGWKRRYPEPQCLAAGGLAPLPSTWTWASLDQLTSLITSGSRAWSPYYGRGSGTFIMAQNVRPGRFTPHPRQPVDPPEDDPERERTRVQRDDLLVTIVGANTGDVCRINADVTDHYVCQSVGLLRPVIAEIAAFTEPYLTSTAGGQAAFKQMMYGAGRPHLSFDQLRSLPIPVPPLSEQSQIATKIGLHTVDDYLKGKRFSQRGRSDQISCAIHSLRRLLRAARPARSGG